MEAQFIKEYDHCQCMSRKTGDDLDDLPPGEDDDAARVNTLGIDQITLSESINILKFLRNFYAYRIFFL